MQFVFYAAMSIDGYLADKRGGVGWLKPFQNEDYGYAEFTEDIDATVMGRRTYDHALRTGGVSYESKPCVVLTHRPLSDGAERVESFSGALAGLAERLEAKGARRAWVMGGGEVVREFMEEGLLDELDLFVMPLVLGGGVHTFPASFDPSDWKLVRTQSYGNGVVRLNYARVREPSHNST